MQGCVSKFVPLMKTPILKNCRAASPNAAAWLEMRRGPATPPYMSTRNVQGNFHLWS